MSTYVTVSDAAKFLKVSSDTIRRWDKKGLIKVHRSDRNYRLFNMEEIERAHDKFFGTSLENNYRILRSKIKTNYTVIELFTGAGGTALGLENAGLKNILHVEINGDCIKTLKKNRPRWKVTNTDVSNVNFENFKADIVEGGFPCQAFSYAGKKMGFEDTRGTLFFEFARCVKEVQPKIALGENVRGLLRHDDGKTLQAMISTLEELGYVVTYRILRSQYLDVPQKRERLIILAIRKDLDLPFLFPKEKNYTISLKEALKDCPASPGQEYPLRKKQIL
ncbi:MAG: DNA (cytosine-5-)-methyltransferase, partial [Candidatus Peregrinibacteria bacterium]